MSQGDALRSPGRMAVCGIPRWGIIATKEHSKVVNSAENQDQDATQHPYHEHTFQDPNGYDEHD